MEEQKLQELQEDHKKLKNSHYALEKTVTQVDHKIELKFVEMFNKMDHLSDEMEETREGFRKYNGLREKIDSCEKRLDARDNQEAGRAGAGKGVRDWTAWVIAIISVVITLLTILSRMPKGG